MVWVSHALYFVIDEFDGIATNYTWNLTPQNNGLMTWGGFNDDNFVCGISRDFSKTWIPGSVTLSVYGINSYGVYSIPKEFQIELLPSNDAKCIEYCETEQKRNTTINFQAPQNLVDKKLPSPENIFENNFSIFPNPNNGKFTVSVPKNENSVSMEISNMLGNTIFRKNFTGQFIEVDISSSPSGLYLLKIEAGGTIYTGKIVLQKE